MVGEDVSITIIATGLEDVERSGFTKLSTPSSSRSSSSSSSSSEGLKRPTFEGTKKAQPVPLNLGSKPATSAPAEDIEVPEQVSIPGSSSGQGSIKIPDFLKRG